MTNKTECGHPVLTFAGFGSVIRCNKCGATYHITIGTTAVPDFSYVNRNVYNGDERVDPYTSLDNRK